mgnify:CR=1 FL=1
MQLAEIGHHAIAELERQQSINEDILRILTLRVEELEEGPSAQLRKRLWVWASNCVAMS